MDGAEFTNKEKRNGESSALCGTPEFGVKRWEKLP